MAKVNLTKRYEVEFAKDTEFHKKGEKVLVNMCLASKFFKDGRISSIPPKLMEDAEALGCKDLFIKGNKKTLEA